MKPLTGTIGVALLACLLMAGAGTALAAEHPGGGEHPRGGDHTTAAITEKADEAAEEAAKKLKPQASCPIMGGKIDKKLFVDAGGYRFYVCCKGCLKPIEDDPAKALAALVAKGEKPEIHAAVCPNCGQIKGTKKCCKTDAGT